MPNLAGLSWNFLNQLRRVDLGRGGTAYYVYDAAGQRVRKVIERQGGQRVERIYLGGVEFYRERLAPGYRPVRLVDPAARLNLSGTGRSKQGSQRQRGGSGYLDAQAQAGWRGGFQVPARRRG